MSETPPWFKFNPNDFLNDGTVKMMSYEARGLYITIICQCWFEDSIPSDPDHIIKMFNLTKHKFKTLWPQMSDKFFEENGKLFNRRVFKEKKDFEIHLQQKRDSGRKGAEKRWQTHKSANGKSIQDKDSDKDIDSDKKKIQKESDPRIAEVFDHYFKKLNKNHAYKLTDKRKVLIKKALGRGHDVATLISAIDGMASDDWEGRSKFNDLKYAIAEIGGEDNVSKWASYEPQKKLTGGHKVGVPRKDKDYGDGSQTSF